MAKKYLLTEQVHHEEGPKHGGQEVDSPTSLKNFRLTEQPENLLIPFLLALLHAICWPWTKSVWLLVFFKSIKHFTKNIANIANAVPVTFYSMVTMIVEITALNYQKFNQCLKGHKSLGLLVSL